MISEAEFWQPQWKYALDQGSLGGLSGEQKERLLEAIEGQGAGASVPGASFVVELPALGGREKLEAMDIEVLSLCTFDGE